jgi:small subunit ribosomal protein S17
MGKRRVLTGSVVSDKMQKTVVVKVISISKHHKYSRIMKSHNKFKAHDEKGIAKSGDTVRIEETRPLSKDKRFRVLNVVKKAEAPDIQIDDLKETKH